MDDAGSYPQDRTFHILLHQNPGDASIVRRYPFIKAYRKMNLFVLGPIYGNLDQGNPVHFIAGAYHLRSKPHGEMRILILSGEP